MKWSIVGLLFFGIVAAVCAAVLVAFMQSRNKPQSGTTVEIFVAAKALQPGMSIDPASIERKEILKTEAPEGACTNAVQVIGKVLLEKMHEGQAFTKDRFAHEGDGLLLASALREGERGIPLALQDYQVAVLYAGCSVDVIATFKESGQSGEAVSGPLLQNVRVLGIEENTVVNEKEDSPAVEGKKSSLNRSRKASVILALDVEQASALELAKQFGTVSLALRGPMDDNPVRINRALLSKLRNGQAAAGAKKGGGWMPEAYAQGQTPGMPGAGWGNSGAEAVEGALTPSSSPDPNDPTWTIKFLKGDKFSEQKVLLQKEGTNGSASHPVP